MSVEDNEKYDKSTTPDSDKFGGCVDGGTLYLYYSNLTSLDGINKAHSFVNITCFIIIGQPLTSLQGVDILTGLSELWVVECKLEGMDEISTCTNLKKLYLYSNNIKTIPEIQGLKNLEVLWLSSNQIQTLKKVNVPNNIKDLHLADNNIPSIPNSCFSETKLVSLNISGNPFKNFKVLHSLTHISTLQNLVLSDPIHNSCPVCYRNNYRTFTIYSLPQIASLDHITISKDERKLTEEYYRDILFYYRILKNQLLTQHYVEYSNIHKNMHSSLELFRKKIFDMVQVRHITLSMYPEGSAAKKEPDIDFELNKQFLLDDASRVVTNSTYDLTANDCRLKIELYKLEYELKSAGRIMFKNFTKDSVLGNISQKLLSEFSCSYLKSTIKVKPQELGVTYIFSADCPQFVEEDSSLNFFIVCSPVSVTELDVRLYSYIDQIINETLDEGILLTVTNCLVAADRLLLDSSAIESVLVCSSSIPRLSLVVYVKDPNTLVESNLSGCHNSTKGRGDGDCKCNKYLVHSCSVVPAFIIEYNYIKLQETFKSNHTQNINIISVKYCNREESSSDTFSRIEKTTIESVLQQPLWSTMDMEQLTELDISSSQIGSFGKMRSQLINVKHLDLSYNNLSTLQEVPNIFPNVVNINASFNVINCISFAKGLPNLEVLDVSWNRISRLVILLLQLKNSTPIIWELDVRYNPILDIHNSNHIDHFVRKYLSELSHFNGKFIKAAESTSTTNVDKFIHASSFNGPNNILTLEWLNSLCCLPPDRKYIGSGPHLGFNSDKKLTCLSAKGQYNFNFALSTSYNIESIQYVDLSSIGLDNVHCLRLIHRLVELNLSDNLLRYIGSFVCNMNYLVRLNLSYNYLNSMKEICDSSLSSLKILDISFNQISSLSGLESCPNLIELYATHNSLNDLEALCTLKNLRKLRTVALNYNEVEKCERFRLFLIYHLHHLEFINGVKIVEEEEITANEEFSGVIDSDHLLKEHNGIQLPHITKLVLSKCNIKDVCLDEKCLINLKVLDLEYNNITCLKGLATLPSLEILNLGYNRVTSLGIQCKPSSVGYVNKLSTFSTSTVSSYFETDDDAACVVVGNTNALSNTDNEKENNPKNIKNQFSCQGQHKSFLFPELKVLALHSNHIISLIPFQFSSFRKLSTLMVQDNFITNLSGLQGVRHLRCLILDKNKITSNAILMEDIEEISTTLTDLYLENNSLRNIKFIKKFTNLKKLYLAQNRIKDQQEIRQLESLNLQELTLWGNAVSRLCNYHYLVLESLPDLRRFDGVHLQNYE